MTANVTIARQYVAALENAERLRVELASQISMASEWDVDAIVQALEVLPTILRGRRAELGLSLREVARQMDVSFSTVVRIESGEDMVLSSAIKALRWVGAS